MYKVLIKNNETGEAWRKADLDSPSLAGFLAEKDTLLVRIKRWL